jgi:signal transduction histidine kinase
VKLSSFKSLRVFLFFTATIALSLILYFSIRQTQSTLKNSYASLKQEHLGNVSAIVSSVVENKIQDLINMGQILRADNDLSTAYVLAHESRNWQFINSKVSSIKSKVNFDWVGILSLNGRPTYENNLPTLSKKDLTLVLNSKTEIVKPFYHSGVLYLSALSTIRLYDKPIGILVLGYNLDYLAQFQLGPLTKSRIQFYDVVKIGDEKLENRVNGIQIISQISYDRLMPIRLSKANFSTPLYTEINTLESPGDAITESLGNKLLLLGAFCLAALILSFNLILDFVFIRPFKLIIKELNNYTQEIRKGNVRRLKLQNFLIVENSILADSFEQLSNTITNYSEEIKEKAKLEVEAKKTKALADLASQVAHDIRSPLAALEIGIKLMPEISEDKRMLIRGAVTRIRDIANDLLNRHKNNNSNSRSAELISSILDSIVSEKRIQYSSKHNLEIDLTLDSYSYGHFSVINVPEFKRVVSNLINNSVEAIADKPGIISVRLTHNPLNKRVVVKISDDGPGIPDSLLSRIGQRGVTSGKKDGHGLGLSYSKSVIESLNGIFSVESKEALGTTITIELAQAPTPSWFLPELRIQPGSTLVIVDDDYSIHKVWQKRLSEAQQVIPQLAGLEMVHFSDGLSFKNWAATHGEIENCLFLMDYELKGEKLTGLDLIKSYGISKNSVLVTSRFDEEEVRSVCTQLKISIIPKGMASFVPILLSQQDDFPIGAGTFAPLSPTTPNLSREK